MRTKRKQEYGDFQTPLELARGVCAVLSKRGLKPNSILEPTCGEGIFIAAAMESFPSASTAIGLEINDDYVRTARAALTRARGCEVTVLHEDFFKADWPDILSSLPDPLLVIGNPPWVTNAELGSLGSTNLPEKNNFQNYRGLDAITGKSNFDISEWMMLKALEWIDGRRATLAMLCKTAVARKVLLQLWKNGWNMESADIYRIDAPQHFGASVEACLLLITTSPSKNNSDCRVHDSLEDEDPRTIFGYRQRRLVSNVTAYSRWNHLEGQERYKWRSGIKHDCSSVMLLRRDGDHYQNGLGASADLEDDYLFPMLKSSDLANGRHIRPTHWMLVTQRLIGDDTEQIRTRAPKTWAYLTKYRDLFERRASSIYLDRPMFSIFGVGPYSFAPWKVAISGFYKKLEFVVVGPYEGRPIVCDDTCYFVACETKREAADLSAILNSDIARQYYSSLVFWDEKRPITIGLLRSLDVLALAKELGVEEEFLTYLERNSRGAHAGKGQLTLFAQTPSQSDLPKEQ